MAVTDYEQSHLGEPLPARGDDAPALPSGTLYAECRATHDGWWCTNRKGDGERHVARDTRGQVMARWKGSDQ